MVTFKSIRLGPLFGNYKSKFLTVNEITIFKLVFSYKFQQTNLNFQFRRISVNICNAYGCSKVHRVPREF